MFPTQRVSRWSISTCRTHIGCPHKLISSFCLAALDANSITGPLAQCTGFGRVEKRRNPCNAPLSHLLHLYLLLHVVYVFAATCHLQHCHKKVCVNIFGPQVHKKHLTFGSGRKSRRWCMKTEKKSTFRSRLTDLVIAGNEAYELQG